MMPAGDRDDRKKEIINDTTDDDYAYYIDIIEFIDITYI